MSLCSSWQWERSKSTCFCWFQLKRRKCSSFLFSRCWVNHDALMVAPGSPIQHFKYLKTRDWAAMPRLLTGQRSTFTDWSMFTHTYSWLTPPLIGWEAPRPLCSLSGWLAFDPVTSYLSALKHNEQKKTRITHEKIVPFNVICISVNRKRHSAESQEKTSITSQLSNEPVDRHTLTSLLRLTWIEHVTHVEPAVSAQIRCSLAWFENKIHRNKETIRFTAQIKVFRLLVHWRCVALCRQQVAAHHWRELWNV